MMNEKLVAEETFAKILQVTLERQFLFRLAGKQGLSENQQLRLSQIEGELSVLWDQHRREVAAKTRFSDKHDWLPRSA